MTLSLLILALFASYLVGSLPTAYLIGKTKGIDIRTIGSGNVGATNALRALGAGAGLAVFLIDALKGAVAVRLIPHMMMGTAPSAVELGCGLAAVLGHDFPWALRFRGGKGVATTIGVLAAAQPWIAVWVVATWLVVFGLARYVSLGSLAAAVAIPIAQWSAHHALPDVAIGAVLAMLIIVQHRSNVRRLFSGAEHRFAARH